MRDAAPREGPGWARVGGGLTHYRHGRVERQAEHDGHGGCQAGCPGAQALRGYLANEGPAELSDFVLLAHSAGQISLEVHSGRRLTSVVPERPETGDEDEEVLQRFRVADLAEDADQQQREGAKDGCCEDDEPAAEPVGCQDEACRGHEGEMAVEMSKVSSVTEDCSNMDAVLPMIVVTRNALVKPLCLKKRLA